MLFNSYLFIFIFLPLTLFGFHLISSRGKYRLALAWLIGGSLFFYGWWNPIYLLLISTSILVNYLLGASLLRNHNKLLLFTGIVFNMGLIGYFKYANFFIDNFNLVFDTNIFLKEIILPLAISFFTFQQIAYLVDAYRGQAEKYDFLHYALFVTFFPQLIAGPIVHHKEMMPQFIRGLFYNIRARHIAIGFSIFTIGLFKKTVLADGISIYSTPVFDAAEIGINLTFFEAWLGSLAYTMQLYFDFSGYSDMAIGLARMFGLKLPVNFYSPYKANNIADFWRRWHITLSRLIRTYLWDPVSLTMTRIAVKHRYGSKSFFLITIFVPTIFTFFWIGLWHGAGWDFIVFGLIHGIYIVIFNFWNRVKQAYPRIKVITSPFIAVFLARGVTFISVVIGWVFFRAESLEGAKNVILAMLGRNTISLSPSLSSNIDTASQWSIGHVISLQDMFANNVLGANPLISIQFIFVLIAMCMILPNTQEIFNKYKPSIQTYDGIDKPSFFKAKFHWKPTLVWRIFIFSLFILSNLSLLIITDSEFLYFQF